ncbi:MAG: hypothetical protein ACXAE3_16240 [Candidatus Kariarchaeaceae archaeon]
MSVIRKLRTKVAKQSSQVAKKDLSRVSKIVREEFTSSENLKQAKDQFLSNHKYVHF